MATTKKRMNISLSKELDTILKSIAKRDQMPQATKAEYLLRIALEMEEDEALDAIARKRDTRGATFVSHTNAWK